MPDIFLSYSREDLATARRFADGFEREGFSVWWDQSLDAGEAFDHVTEKALEEARIVVVLWSKHSVESRWVRAEANQADRQKKLVPVEIEPCKRPIMFDLTQTASLAHWSGDASDKSWQSLIAGLRRQLDKGASSLTARSAAPSVPLRKSRGLAIGLVALLGAGLVAFLVNRAPVRPDAVPASATATQTAPVTLAVLPFADLSPAHDQENFSDGLTEEILNQLAQIKDLLVTGRTSSFSFKGKNEDLRVIAEKLGVANLLEGSIRKDGDTLRITAQLIDGKTGGHLWSQTYDREKSGVFAMQEDIARDVAKALSVKLDVGDIAGMPGMTRNVEAYDAYLAAVPLIRASTADSLRQCIAQLQRAIALDPGFAFARAALWGMYRFSAPLMLQENSPQTWRAKAAEELEAARRIEPDAFYVQVMLAEQDVARGRWNDAARKYQVAASSGKLQTLSNILQVPMISGDSGLPANFLWRVGRFKEAIALLEQVKARDPLDVGAAGILAENYADSGNLEASFSEWNRGLQLQGGQLLVRGSGFLTALATRDRTKIEYWLQSLASLAGFPDPDFPMRMRRLLDQPEQQAQLELRKRAQVTPTAADWFVTGSLMAYFGDPQGALELFLRESRNPDNTNDLAIVIWRPVLRDIRRLPGFKDLAREMGFVDYWREFGWPDLCKPIGKDDFECT